MQKSKREVTGREMFANWAGYGADPVLDPELFRTLPVRVQKEKLELRRVWGEHPGASAGEIQAIIRDLHSKAAKVPEIPEWFKFSIVPVSSVIFSWSQVECRWTPEQVADAIAKLEAHVSMDSLLAACSENYELGTSKPIDGVFAYIWRVARFNSGLDTFIPVTSLIDLADGLSCLGVVESNYTSLKPVLLWLQEKANSLVDRCGEDKSAATVRYGRTIGLIQ